MQIPHRTSDATAECWACVLLCAGRWSHLLQCSVSMWRVAGVLHRLQRACLQTAGQQQQHQHWQGRSSTPVHTLSWMLTYDVCKGNHVDNISLSIRVNLLQKYSFLYKSCHLESKDQMYHCLSSCFLLIFFVVLQVSKLPRELHSVHQLCFSPDSSKLFASSSCSSIVVVALNQLDCKYLHTLKHKSGEGSPAREKRAAHLKESWRSRYFKHGVSKPSTRGPLSHMF